MVRSSKPTTDKDPEPGRATTLHTKLEFTRFGDPLDGEQLASPELWWSQHYQWFKDNGYLLRPRYAPDWVPSWRGTKKNGFMCEDGRVPYVCHSGLFDPLYFIYHRSMPANYLMAHVFQMVLMLL